MIGKMVGCVVAAGIALISFKANAKRPVPGACSERRSGRNPPLTTTPVPVAGIRDDKELINV